MIKYSAQGQNGTIIERNQYQVSDSIITNLQKTLPIVHTIITQVNFYHITYLSDGLKIKGYLAVPKKPGKYPCIIFNKGGYSESSKLTDEGFLFRLGELCSNGYVIAASQYRGTDGGGGKQEFGGKDVNDVLNLIPILNYINQADTSRIGMYGWSRGGMMTYLALTKTNKIKAAVVGSGVVSLMDMPNLNKNFESMIPLIQGYSKNKTETLKQRSAIYFAKKINRNTPILILQGTADNIAPTPLVLTLIDKFYKQKQPFRFILYEGGTHSLLDYRKEYNDQLTKWFDTYLRDNKKWPSLEIHQN